jgi:hypothetical protein
VNIAQPKLRSEKFDDDDDDNNNNLTFILLVLTALREWEF